MMATFHGQNMLQLFFFLDLIKFLYIDGNHTYFVLTYYAEGDT